MKQLAPGQSGLCQFFTTDPTGAAVAATGTPAITVTHNGVDLSAGAELTAWGIVVTSLATGRYKVAYTVPTTYAAGDTAQLSQLSTVSGIANIPEIIEDVQVVAHAIGSSVPQTGDCGVLIPQAVTALADMQLLSPTSLIGFMGKFCQSNGMRSPALSDITQILSRISTHKALLDFFQYQYPAANVVTAASTSEANVRAAYTAAKALGGLTATNRAIVLLKPGTTTLTAALVLDTNYIDFGLVSPTQAATTLTSAGGGKNTVTQTAGDIRLVGFSITNTGNTGGIYTPLSGAGSTVQDYALNVVCDNTASIYSRMYCNGYVSVAADPAYDLNGTWWRCTGGYYAWRAFAGRSVRGSHYFGTAGVASWGSDDMSSSPSTALNAFMFGCSGAGDCCCGCLANAGMIGPDAELWFNSMGDNSYALANEIAGKLFYNSGLNNCFAGMNIGSTPISQCGTISGLLVGNKATGGCSFASGGVAGCWFNTYSETLGMGITGTLIDNNCDGLTAPLRLLGGRIQGGSFTQTTAGLPVITVADTYTDETGAAATTSGPLATVPQVGRIYDVTLSNDGTVPLITADQQCFGSQAGNWARPTSGIYDTTIYRRYSLFNAPVVAASVLISWKESGTSYTATLDTASPVANIVSAHASGTVNLTTGAWRFVTASGNNVDDSTLIFTYRATTSVATRGCLCKTWLPNISPGIGTTRLSPITLGPDLTDVESGSQNPVANMPEQQALGTLTTAVAAIPTNPYTGTPPTKEQIAGAVLDEAKGTHIGLLASVSTLTTGAKMDLVDSVNQTGVTDLKTKLGTIPASLDWSADVSNKPTLPDAIERADGKKAVYLSDADEATLAEINEAAQDAATAAEDKTGMKLASDGLDGISVAIPTADVADWNFRERMMMLYRRFFGKASETSTEIKTYAANGSTVLSTQNVSDDAVTETQGEAS